MGNDVVPFGKYRGQPIESLAQDQQYADWLVAQPWFRERYSGLYTIIINHFKPPEDTPEHNALQALFLSHDYRMKVVSAYAMPNIHIRVRENSLVWAQKEVEDNDKRLAADNNLPYGIISG